MHIRKLFLTISFLLTMALMPGLCFAGEIDILVNKLVEKGVLSHGEAQEIITETKEEVRAQIAAGTSDMLPGWLQRTKLKGDLRLRYQYSDTDGDSKSGRHRERVRFRLGLESKVNEQWTVLAGLATGSSDPRSTNQTMQDTFSTKGINLDYAYAVYAPAGWLNLYGGKMKRKPILWEPTDLLWDGDVNPEGVAFTIENSLDQLDLFMNSGFFILDESSSKSNEPYMAYVQPGMEWEMTDNVKLKAALTGYIVHTKNYNMDNSADTNSKNTLDSTLHRYDYDSVSPAVELKIREPLNGIVPYFSCFGEYINANDPNSENSGYAVGFKLGDKKVKKKGNWQAKYIYRKLERDAWFDALPDSDAYDGETNVKGHEVAFKYGLSKNVELGLDYYHMNPIKDLGSQYKNREQDVVQVDCVMKF